MKRSITGLILAAAVLATARLSYAVDSEAGTARAGIVSLQSGARSAGMGGAFTAVADDINAIYHNVAGVGFMTASEFQATQANGMSDFELSDLAVAIPLGDVTASNVRQLGTIVLNIGTLDYGSQDAFNGSGAPIGRLNANDDTLALGWGKAFNSRFAIGALGRFVDASIFRRGESFTVIDGGLLFKAVPGYLNLALAASDISDDSPSEYRGGAALTPSDNVTLSAEVGTAEDRGSIIRGGLEFRPVSAFALRVGYDDTFDAGSGLSFGAGIQLLNFEVGFFPLEKVALDYAYSPADDLDAWHRVSISARIGTY